MAERHEEEKNVRVYLPRRHRTQHAERQRRFYNDFHNFKLKKEFISKFTGSVRPVPAP